MNFHNSNDTIVAPATAAGIGAIAVLRLSGKDAFKIRLKITSKGKGKSGGARVITLIESAVIGITEQTSPQEITLNLLSIYDKSDMANISDKELKDLLRSFYNQSK